MAIYYSLYSLGGSQHCLIGRKTHLYACITQMKLLSNLSLFSKQTFDFGPIHLLNLLTLGWWIMWFISIYQENKCCPFHTVGNPVVTTHKRYFGPPPFWQTIWAGEPFALFRPVQTPEWFWAAFSAAIVQVDVRKCQVLYTICNL